MAMVGVAGSAWLFHWQPGNDLESDSRISDSTRALSLRSARRSAIARFHVRLPPGHAVSASEAPTGFNPLVAGAQEIAASSRSVHFLISASWLWPRASRPPF